MQKLLDFLYPPRCQLCGSTDTSHQSVYLCAPCAGDIPDNPHACSLCAIPLSTTDLKTDHQSKICGSCTKTPPVYDASWSPFIYAQPLEWMIQELKFNAKLNFASLLSNLMTKHLPSDLLKAKKPDVIIPMPLHSRRLKQRGFNQSHILIKPIAKHLDLPIDINSSQRIRNTEHQTGKSARQRAQNIKNAFTFNNQQAYQHAVIFDDVVTTGSSVTELTKTLKRAGVNRVDVWCLARAEKRIK